MLNRLKLLFTGAVVSSALLVFGNLPDYQEPKVYVCHSGTSYAYHNRYCQGLKRCTHKIDTVTVKEAVKSGHKTPCGYCYR